MAVEVRYRAQAEARRVDRVHLRHASLPQVSGGSQAVFLGLLEQRRHELRPVRAELQAVDAVLRRPANPGARLLRRVDGSAVPATSRPLIVEDPGRHDLVAGAAVLLFDGNLVRRQPDAAHRRDPVGHPQLVRILGIRVLGRSAGVHVQVDKPRHHVHPGGIDLMVGILGRSVGLERHPRRSGTANLPDTVAFDHDIHRSLGRAPRAVNERRAADDQRLERAPALVRPAVGSGDQLARLLRLLRCGLRWLLRQQRGDEYERAREHDGSPEVDGGKYGR